jgi:uncharacterized protein (TIGR01777 family)
MTGNGRIILAGGSGFLGQALAAELLNRGHQVVVLSRKARDGGVVRQVPWDGRSAGPWVRELDGALAVINLAGRSVNCRHSRANRQEIISSRVDSVLAIGKAISACASPPRAWIQASGLAYYGNTGDRICDESCPASADSFMARTSAAWEQALESVPTPATRRVILRLGMVLGQQGGALPLLVRLTRWGLGGSAGSGRQYISWIHLRDMVRIFLAAIDRQDLAGPYNACAPDPEPNRYFMREMRRRLHRPWSPPAPAPLVRLGAWLLGSSGQLALGGQRCLPRRMLEAGFTFEYAGLGRALEDLCAGAGCNHGG